MIFLRVLVDFSFYFWYLSWWSLEMHSWSITRNYSRDLSTHCCCSLFIYKTRIVKTLSWCWILLKKSRAHWKWTTVRIYPTFLFPFTRKLWRRRHNTVLFIVRWRHCINPRIIHINHFISKRIFISRSWANRSHWNIDWLIWSIVKKVFDLFEMLRIKLRKVRLW